MEDDRCIAKEDNILKKLVSDYQIEGDVYSSDEELDLPYESNDVSDDIDEIVFREQIRGAKKFFKDLTEFDDDELSDIVDDVLDGRSNPSEDIVLKPSAKYTDALSYFEMAMERNSKMRDMLLAFKQALLTKKQEYEDLIVTLECNDECIPEPEPKQDEIISSGFPGYLLNKDGVVFTNKILTFLCQFSPPYFKDKANFFCPPNLDSIDRENQFKISVSSFQPSKQWSPQCIEQLENAIKKSLVDEFKSRADFKAIYRWREYNSFVKSSSLESIIKAKPPEYKIDWLRVAALLPLEERRTSTECSKLWDLYLDPAILKDSFTAEEDEKLIQLAMKHNEQNWDTIASELSPVRSAFQIFSYYQSSLMTKVHRGTRWTPKEDEFLKNVITSCTYGNYISWKKIMYYCEKRSYNQIYNRWHNNLSCPRRGKFSAKEDRAMMTALSHGLGYKDTAQILGGQRSKHQIRERLMAIVKFGRDNGLNIGGWSVEEDVKLINLVETHGENWAHIAKMIGTRDRTQVRHRFTRLRRRMEVNPNFNINDVDRRNKTGLSRKSKMKKSNLLKMLESGKISKKRKKSLISYVHNILEDNEYDRLSETAWENPRHFFLCVWNYLIDSGSNYWEPLDHYKTYPTEKLLLLDSCTLLNTKLNYDLYSDSLKKDEHLKPVHELLEDLKGNKIFEAPAPSSSTNLSDSLEASTSSGIKSQKLMLFPPNSMTCSGFLNCLSFLSNKEKTLKGQIDHDTDSEEVKKAKELFQQRLIQLFLWPAILSGKEKKNKLKTYCNKSANYNIQAEPSVSSKEST